MAWFGKILDFKASTDRLNISVGYYDDTNPGVIFERDLSYPLGATQAQVVSDIKSRGAEIRSIVTLNNTNVIGTVIPIP